MPTNRVTLTKTAIQLSNGSAAVFAESSNGIPFRFAVSNDSPDKRSYHTANELNINEGFCVWAWSPTADSISLIVSVAD